MSPRIKAHLLTTVCGLSIYSLCSGCTQWQTLKECRALVDQVNTAAEAIDQVRASAPVTAATYKTVAGQYDQLARVLAMTEHDDPELAKTTGDYIEFLGSLAKNTRAYAKALTRKDKRKLTATTVLGARHARDVTAITRRFTRVCYPR